MRYRITMTTVASFTVEIEADNEDAALDAAHGVAEDLSAQYIPVPHRGADSLSLNDSWELKSPEVTEVS